MQTWPVSNPTCAVAATLFPLQLQFPVLLESGMFCCFFSPFLTSEVLDGHLLLHMDLGTQLCFSACSLWVFIWTLCWSSGFHNSWLKSEVLGFHCAAPAPSC